MPNQSCPLCHEPIGVQEPLVCLVGGFFHTSEPDIFVEDHDVLRETFVHARCITKSLANH